MAVVSYLYWRGARYYYRRRLHLWNLISRPITIALGTADPAEARRSVGRVSDELPIRRIKFSAKFDARLHARRECPHKVHTMAAGDWTDRQNDAIVADYFAMLADDEAGRPYSKAEHNRNLQQLIGRPRGSIEYKHQNISAVLKGLGEDWIPGYKPAFNYQRSLEDAVARWLTQHPAWLSPDTRAGSTGEPHPPVVREVPTLWIGPPPTLSNIPPPDELEQMQAIARRFDVAERDARNRALGRAGEERIVFHERSSLVAAGRDDLAERVRWISEQDGDGAGYDIASFEMDGRLRLIEVKATNGWERTPFHISRNELAVSEERRRAEFPYRFITAFGAKKTTVDRLRKGDSNQSDVGGVLQRNNIHIAVAPAGGVHDALSALRESPKTASNKAKFILATDGDTVEAEDLVGGDVIACAFADLPRYFATFLPLAGISTIKEIKNNPIDVKATGRLNKLYVTLLNDNPDWATEERRHALNQFMARLIFCYFAEDTGIFNGEGLFTATVAKMSEAGHGTGDAQWGNTHEVLQHLFLAMETPVKHEGNFDDRYRRAAGICPYADVFPYVNGGLFTAAGECPRFSRTARAYLLSAGELDWKEINPDIFGSMIQAVADDGERGELGMHYTSVPNILKVLNPLFLDDLREQLEAAGDSRQKLRNLRKRLATIRVFDPAYGSGNFLVIAYKHMRAIEATIVERLGGEASLKLDERRSVIPLSNFYGIEIKSFAAEIARLALLIAEFQADCLYLSQQEARAMVLPLHKTGQITVGNALRVDWLEVCPPVAAPVGAEQDLGGPTGRLALEGNGLDDGGAGETYICGNPPYKGFTYQTASQKADLERLLSSRLTSHKSLDYIAGWFVKGRDYLMVEAGTLAFVTTNSICQGEVVPNLWPMLLSGGFLIPFAYTSFKWTNLASHNAGVTVAIVGLTQRRSGPTRLFEEDDEGQVQARSVDTISPYLVPGGITIVQGATDPPPGRARMLWGNKPTDGGNLLLDEDARERLVRHYPHADRLIRPFYGSAEFIRGAMRYCLWIENDDLADAMAIPPIANRIENVRTGTVGNFVREAIVMDRKDHRYGDREGRVGPVAGWS